MLSLLLCWKKELDADAMDTRVQALLDHHDCPWSDPRASEFGLEARDTLFGQIYHLDRLLLGCSEDQERYVQAVKLARPHHTLTRNQRQEVCTYSLESRYAAQLT